MDSNLPPNAWLIASAVPCRVSCVLLAACLASSGCATVINGSTQRVAVASEPPGAQLYVNDAPVGVTPAFVDVPRRDPDLELRLEKDGYEPATLPLERSRSGWIAGNVLLAGVPFNDYGVGQWVGAMAMAPWRCTGFWGGCRTSGPVAATSDQVWYVQGLLPSGPRMRRAPNQDVTRGRVPPARRRLRNPGHATGSYRGSMRTGSVA
ncbi:MAG: PEGA domain-containing protein [Acidobacteria bacterium]|nr:PEGA domain-containing protein [Acidobacteriota bacterium]